jgi:hypothetical protein
MKNAMKFIVSVALLISLTGCGEKKERVANSENKSSSLASEAFPASLKLATAPQNAVSIGVAKKTAKSGDKIVIKGEIGGRKIGTFNSDLAAFFLVDPEQASNCRKEQTEGCPTPWDYCCTPKEVLMNAICFVQVQDPTTGQLVKKSIKGWQNLQELSEVIVVGSVSPESSDGNLIINAEGIFIVK